MRRFSLLTKFGAASLVLIVLLGVVMATVLRGQIRSHTLADARDEAVVAARLGIQPTVSPDDLAHSLSADHQARLDDAVRSAIAGGTIVRVKLWNRAGTVVYSDDRPIVGQTFPQSDELREALEGKVASEVSTLSRQENVADRSFGKLLEVYVPLRFGTQPAVDGVFELYKPYAPLAANIDHDTHTVYGLLLGGLGLLWIALFRIVAGASRRLRRHADETRHQARHDATTGLPNRGALLERAGEVIARARADGSGVALMLVDLDRFKEINDTLGHDNGDLLLQEVGARLQSTVGEDDMVARLGGDEFAVLLPGVAETDRARQVAVDIARALHEPIAVAGLSLPIDASIGIALFPEHGEDAGRLMQRADVALYEAKGAHRGHEVYSPARDGYSPERLGLMGELRRAIGEGGLVLHYQPTANIESGRVTGVEALVRWSHPERGLVLPDQFIPLAERTGMMRQLTAWVLGEALGQCRTWQLEDIGVSVAVNLSMRDLHDLALPDLVGRLLREHGVAPDRLELEITESSLMEDPERVLEVLDRLSAMDVRLAIDDFGTGYSSLAYLQRMPVRKLKIDRRFVTHMLDDENDLTIVRSTIDLGRSLGLEVVAEGVETEDVWRRLGELGCHLGQGYHLLRPVPATEISVWLAPAATAMRHASALGSASRLTSWG